MAKKEKVPTVKSLIVIAECSDGKMYQVLAAQRTQMAVQTIIELGEGEIKCFSTPLEGLELKKL